MLLYKEKSDYVHERSQGGLHQQVGQGWSPFLLRSLPTKTPTVHAQLSGESPQNMAVRPSTPHPYEAPRSHGFP